MGGKEENASVVMGAHLNNQTITIEYSMLALPLPLRAQQNPRQLMASPRYLYCSTLW
jgi:hypothetical protein